MLLKNTYHLYEKFKDNFINNSSSVVLCYINTNLSRSSWKQFSHAIYSLALLFLKCIIIIIQWNYRILECSHFYLFCFTLNSIYVNLVRDG